jgi:hypothetical protein
VQPPKPASQLENVGYFAGTWTSSGDLQASLLGPAGKMTMVEHNQWMEGGFFLVMRSEFEVEGTGRGSGMAFMGYDPERRVYTYDEFNSMGEAEHSIGTLHEGTWTWTRDLCLGGNAMKGRFIMKTLSPMSYTFRFGMSPDGSDWFTIMDGMATKQ